MFIALLVLVGVGAGVVAWYTAQLNSALSYESGDSSELDASLTDVLPGDAFYVLLLGSDERENGRVSYSDYEHSDVMMLLRVDPKHSLVTMLTVPRDIGYRQESGKYIKLNEVFAYEGAAASVEAVEEVTGVSIAHFAVIHGTGLENLVDLLGGITVDVPVAIDFTNIANEEVHLEPGVQRLNGAEALGLANTRAVYSERLDANRQQSARLVVQGILDEIRAIPVTELPGVVLAAADCVSTDMSASEVVDIVMQVGGNATTYSGTGPNAGCINPWANDFWLCYDDPEGWRRVMETIEAGGDPSTVSYEGDVVTLPNAPAEFPPVVLPDPSGYDALEVQVEADAYAFIAGEQGDMPAAEELAGEFAE